MTLQKQIKKSKPNYSFHYKQIKHGKSHHYIKPYLPYLPIVLISVLGFSLSSYISSRSYTLTNKAYLTANQIGVGNQIIFSLIKLKHNNLIMDTIIFLSLILIIIFLLRHMIFLKKIIIDGEKILLKNTWLDIFIILILISSFIILKLK